MNNIDPEIMDKITKVCLCKAINRAKFKELIKNGMDNIEDIRKATGAGSGPCKGMRCTPKILNLIEQHKNGEY